MEPAEEPGPSVSQACVTQPEASQSGLSAAPAPSLQEDKVGRGDGCPQAAEESAVCKLKNGVAVSALQGMPA